MDRSGAASFSSLDYHRQHHNFSAHSTFLSLCRRHHHHHRHLHRYHSFISSPLQMYHNITGFSNNRPMRTNAESVVEPSELSGRNAYDILGVSESCTFAEIKASFRKLEKETHPDISQSADGFYNSNRFVQIHAAYEVATPEVMKKMMVG